jgi:hypothetical protein
MTVAVAVRDTATGVLLPAVALSTTDAETVADVAAVADTNAAPLDEDAVLDGVELAVGVADPKLEVGVTATDVDALPVCENDVDTVALADGVALGDGTSHWTKPAEVTNSSSPMLMVLPYPSWPNTLEPQQLRLTLSLNTAHVWRVPAAISLTGPDMLTNPAW